METWMTMFITVICSIAASSGFWAWLQKRGEKNSTSTQMLLGLAHDRLVYLTLKYIEEGHISKEEFENLEKYLYEPYKKLGGNGTVAHLMDEVRKIPIRSSIYHHEHQKGGQ